MKNKVNITRTQAREVEKKFTDAMKLVSKHMHSTGENVPPEFIGYKVPAGKFTDATGREWQVQAHAVCSKSHLLSKNEVIPMFRKWAIGIKFRIWLKAIVDKIE